MPKAGGFLKAAFILALVLALSLPAAGAEITIGLVPEMNVFKQVERFRHLQQYLSEKTGVKVKLTVIAQYGDVLDKFEKMKLDGAFLGSFTGALAMARLGLEPLARPVNLDGTSTYCGYIFVRKDSGIKGLKGMRGKRMAFVDRATTAGYIFPVAWLKEHGVDNPARFFSEYYFTGSHDAAIDAVLNREADVGCAKHSIYNRVKAENPRVEKELVVLEISPNVPENGLLVRKTMDPALKHKLKEALLGMGSDKKGREALRGFGALTFIDTTAADYNPVFRLSAKAGIDIRTYHCENR